MGTRGQQSGRRQGLRPAGALGYAQRHACAPVQTQHTARPQNGWRTLQGRPLITMYAFLRTVPACWGLRSAGERKGRAG